MDQRVRVGLVGAGPWAQLFTAPMLRRAVDVDFVGIWARRPDASAALAKHHGAAAFADFDEMIRSCDAVAFSVPPSVQAALATTAASAGKAVLLDKPVARTLAQADALAAAIDRAGVISQVNLTNRYTDEMRQFLTSAASFDSYGGRAWFFGNGCVEGTTFGTPWRVADGGLLDLGPHVFDALHAVLGPIRAIEAHGDSFGLVLVACEHEDGHISQAAISATTNQSGWLTVELHGPAGRLAFDLAGRSPSEMGSYLESAQVGIMEEFVGCLRSGTPHPLDVQHGLLLQRLIDDATQQLRRH